MTSGSHDNPPGDATTEAPDARAEQTDQKISRRFVLKLSSLFLDPNNYRLVDHAQYKGRVSEDRLFRADVQRQTQRLILGESFSNVQDLLASFQQNGWLDVEPIHVRQVGTRYLVVEGNRRVATLKALEDRYAQGGEIGSLDPTIFDRVPVVRYAETDLVHHLIIMGLHHISGKRQWPAISQAKLMKELRDEHGQNPDEICKALAITKREFNLSLRTLKLAESYKASDYGDQFRPEMFNLFREVLRSPALRDWLEWDDSTDRAANQQRLQRLFSWLSRDIAATDLEPDADSAAENTRAEVEPAIATGVQVRELARIIQDPEAVRLLDETRNLQSASRTSGVLARSEVDGALLRVEQAATLLFSLVGRLEFADRTRIEELVDRLNGVLTASGRRKGATAVSTAPWTAYNEIRGSQFQDVIVNDYRGLRGTALTATGRVNLIAGINNAGKTSLLEAIFLLARQSDSRGLLEVVRRRARTEVLPDANTLVSLIPEKASIHARFDGRDAALSWLTANEPADDVTDRATFVRLLRMDARYGERTQNSATTIRSSGAPVIRTHGDNRILCPAEFSSPFSLADQASLVTAHEASSRTGAKAKIIEFIRDQLAPGLAGINLINTSGRFLVSDHTIQGGRDLSAYGEGMQRVFHIAMLFASVAGGVLVIDEFENAIHARAFSHFARLICALAREFSVQVFLSTHSAEVIEAWTSTEQLRSEVVGYGLRRDEDHIEAVRFDGEKLHELHEAIGFDLRGIA